MHCRHFLRDRVDAVGPSDVAWNEVLTIWMMKASVSGFPRLLLPVVDPGSLSSRTLQMILESTKIVFTNDIPRTT